jgi:hypothetical protein
MFVRKLIYMTYHFANTEPTQTAITPGKFFAERLSSVSNAEEKSWQTQIRRQQRQLWHDNKGARPTLAREREACLMVR